ncbi:MAG: hypothetical protein QN716_01595 [Nitrososphaeraceae archaeon]|nr:hypothetical protein [Nitrososphaeraceae archaeon]
MKKYVKLPIETDAVQLSIENIYEVRKWANSIQPKDKQIGLYFTDEPDDTENWMIKGLIIPTKEGNMICSIGDFLIKEPFPTDDRMFYPCKPDMFDLTYREK